MLFTTSSLPRIAARRSLHGGVDTRLIVSSVFVVSVFVLLFGAPEYLWGAHGDESAVTRASRLVRQHCHDCHGGDDTNAGIDLAAFNNELDVWSARGQWRKVLHALQDRLMPPDDGEALADSDRDFLVDWLEHTLANVDVSRLPRDPGTIPPRRLNRYEYNYTIEDLFGVVIHPADAFPRDQIYGDGFDNEAISLTVGGLWFEKAFAAAEETVRAVWRDPVALARLLPLRPTPPIIEDRAAYVTTASQAGSCDLGSDSFTIVARFSATEPGSIFLKSPAHAGFVRQSKELTFDDDSMVYRIRRGRELRAENLDLLDGDQHTVVLRVDRQRATLMLDGRLLVSLAGFSRPDDDQHRLSIGRPRAADVDLEDFVSGFASFMYFDHAVGDDQLSRLRADGELRTVQPRFHWHPGIKQERPVVVTAEQAAAESLETFLFRAFRRPPSDAELARYMGLFRAASDDGLPFDVAMQLPIKAALVSPSFLFRSEASSEVEGPYPVSSMEMASRLSYWLWSSSPDDLLLESGRSGGLSRTDELLRQANRLLKHERAERFFERFTLQWLRTEGLGEEIKPDADRFPEITADLMQAMKRESVMVFADTLRNRLPVTSLLDRNTTFVNRSLAMHYGLAEINDDQWHRVSTDGLNRGGILTQAATLTVSSSPRRTSPVFRGKWVLDVLLGEPPPPPPPNVPELSEQAAKPGASLRELLEAHRRQPACAACHNRIDPIGFALEQYDATGRIRSTPQDTRATLADGETIDGAAELNHRLLTKNRDAFVRQITQKMLSFALGRDLQLADERALQKIMTALRKDDFGSDTLIREIVLSDPYRFRMDQSGQPEAARETHDLQTRAADR